VTTESELDALRRENADLKRQVVELRSAIDALLRPTGPDFVSQSIQQLRPDRPIGGWP
jgi:hypothetical protein